MMKQNRNIKITKLCIIALGVSAIVVDGLSCYIIPKSYHTGYLEVPSLVNNVMVIILGNIPSWICLAKLYRLLLNIEQSNVFSSENVKLLQSISMCLLAIGFIFLVGSYHYFPCLTYGGVAVFIALVVRVVRDVFIEAIKMKDELDLTI